MKALITGASSGIGRELAGLLAPRCEEIVLAGRNEERLNAAASEISAANPKVQVKTVAADLTQPEACYALHDAYPGIDLLVNNAGFGDFGTFWETAPEKDVAMIETNVRALHLLMKLYLADMVRRDSGQILNVASVAAFMPGPLMATYYATKAYVLRLSEAVREELRRAHSKVKISVLCPGPVKTNFENAANIGFNFNGIDVHRVAAYAASHLNRFYLAPTWPVRLARVGVRPWPASWVARVVYRVQSRRRPAKP